MEDGVLRFDLDGMARAFVLKSGRLYEREYVGPAPEAQKEQEEPRAEPKPEPQADAASGDPIVEQLGYRGEVERVDTRVFRNRVVCDCGNVRWVKNADMFQVKKCKPCTLKERKQRRRKGGGNGKA
jgi:hypothetical protein